jgi:hypothetical protein
MIYEVIVWEITYIERLLWFWIYFGVWKKEGIYPQVRTLWMGEALILTIS